MGWIWSKVNTFKPEYTFLYIPMLIRKLQKKIIANARANNTLGLFKNYK